MSTGDGKDGILPYPRTPQQIAARDAISGLKGTVDDTTEIMKTNMELVNDRGEKLKNLEHKTESILSGAKEFAHDAASYVKKVEK